MNPQNIDRASFALSQTTQRKLRAAAEREMKRHMQSMSATECAKLNRLLSGIKFLGDVGKAAGKSRVSRSLLDKWMNTPGVSWNINRALNEAQALSHGGDTAEDILFKAKVDPQVQKDAVFFEATGQRHRESKVMAKLAAQNLKGQRWQIIQAANNGDKHFFIDLGRILSGDASRDLYDKLDADIAELFVNHPAMSTAQAVIELSARGHSEVEENTVKQRKRRLGLAKSIAAKSDKGPRLAVTGDRANASSLDAAYDSSNTTSRRSDHRPRKRRPAD